MKRTTLTILALIVLSPFAWSGQAVHKSVSATPQGLVEISNIDGSVTIEGWDQPTVEVSGTLADGVKELELVSHGDRVSVEVRYENRLGRRQTEDTRLLIRLPFASRIEVETVSADIDLAGVQGPAKLETVSGEIRIRSEIQDLEAETVSGDIIVERASGRLEAESVSGAIKVLDGSPERLEAETVSGRLEIRALPAPGASFDIESHSGNVDLALPSGFAARFEVSSFSGNINNELGPAAQKTGEYGPGHRLDFSTGGGGSPISITTFSGNIHLKTR